MTRRDFLHTLTKLFGLIALPLAAQAEPAPRRLIQQCPLAGFQHHDGDELWNYLTVGDSLQFSREPGNRQSLRPRSVACSSHRLKCAHMCRHK